MSKNFNHYLREEWEKWCNVPPVYLWYHHSQCSRDQTKKLLFPSFRHIFWNHIFCISESSPVRLHHPSWDTLYIHPSLSLWRRLEPTSGCVQKTGGGGNEKKGAKKAAGEEETPGWINGRNIKKEGEENGRKWSIMRKSGGRREISFAREPFDASNQRHHVRILIIEAFICANKHRSPDTAKWATYLFVPPE